MVTVVVHSADLTAPYRVRAGASPVICVVLESGGLTGISYSLASRILEGIVPQRLSGLNSAEPVIAASESISIRPPLADSAPMLTGSTGADTPANQQSMEEPESEERQEEVAPTAPQGPEYSWAFRSYFGGM